IRRWDLASRKELDQDAGHNAPVTAVAIAPDGKLLASASTLGEGRVWSPLAGKQINRWSATLVGDLVLAFAPDNKTVATASGTDAVRLWDAVSAEARGQLAGPPDDPVLSLAFGTDMQSLAVGHRGGAIRVWDLADKKVVHQLKYNGPVHTLAYSQDGKTLAASGGNQVAL